MKTCTKLFGPYPFAHRQPTHDGHCKLIHGHDWQFEIEFEASSVDGNGFVLDFGKTKFIKDKFTEWFDHTFVIPNNDPELEFFKQVEQRGLAKLTILPEASAEGLAEYLLFAVDELVRNNTGGRVTVRRVTVFEDEKNSATATHESL